ncbi:MAG TPA: UPF0149 family protein [Burkholderiales bacterium]|nr:UPF0149 family protein [Burkholderiales bacterium]
MTQTDRPLSNAELDRLEQLLVSEVFHEEAMPLDMLQGLFCAVASAPDLIPPSRWLPVALGENPDYETPEQAQEILDLVMRFYAQTMLDLDEGTGITLYVFPNDEGEDDLATWCEGYLEGVILSEADWYEYGEPEQVEALLFPFMLLSGRMREAADEAGDPVPSLDEEGQMRREAANSMGDSVIAVYSYWLDKRVSHPPIRRDGPKVGRNDPCPCGSGRKYKSCHGSLDTN